MSFDWYLNNKKQSQFLSALHKAMFNLGPGEPMFLVISDDEFFELYGSRPDKLTKNEGIWSVLVEAWGTRVYVTCPKFQPQNAEVGTQNT